MESLRGYHKLSLRIRHRHSFGGKHAARSSRVLRPAIAYRLRMPGQKARLRLVGPLFVKRLHVSVGAKPAPIIGGAPILLHRMRPKLTLFGSYFSALRTVGHGIGCAMRYKRPTLAVTY